MSERSPEGELEGDRDDEREESGEKREEREEERSKTVVALFVILTFVGFILADGIVQYVESRKEKPAARPAVAPVRPVAQPAVPGGLFLGRGHAWMEVARNGLARIGGDSFLTQLVGRIERIELPEPGRLVRKGDALFSLYSGGRKAVVTAPVDGIIRSVNSELQLRPQTLADEPYGDGWVCEVEPQNLSASMSLMRVGQAAQTWIREEMDRFREFLSVQAHGQMAPGMVLPDGGDLRAGVLESVNDETWQAFQSEFLAQDRA